MRTLSVSIAAVSLLLGTMTASASSPRGMQAYRDVHAGFEILIPYDWDFGLLTPTNVVFNSPRTIMHWVSVGFAVHAIGPIFVESLDTFTPNTFRERCSNDPSDPRPMVTRVYSELRIGGQPALGCLEESTEFDEYYGPDAMDRRIIVQSPHGGAVAFRLVSCTSERCTSTRDLFEAILDSLAWLD